MAEARKEYIKNKWVESQVFQTAKEEQDFFLNAPHWMKLSSREDSLGTKTRYYCNAVSKRKDAKCPAEIYVQKLNRGASNKLFRNGEPHQHEGRIQGRISVEPATKDKIRTMWSANTTPRQISHQLREDNAVAAKPSSNQVIIKYV